LLDDVGSKGRPKRPFVLFGQAVQVRLSGKIEAHKNTAMPQRRNAKAKTRYNADTP
jgi:hypothetical protein